MEIGKFNEPLMKIEEYKELSDNQLWSSWILQKDEKAFECLYRRHYSSLLAYALSFGYERNFIKDCIQDLFVKLLMSKSLRPVVYVKAFLYKSLRNIMLDRLDTVVSYESLDELVSHDLLIDDLELKKIFLKDDKDIKESRLLLEKYNLLLENQKNAIYLYYIKELSWEEMAVALDISPHSCMNLIARSIAKLKSLVENKEKD